MDDITDFGRQISSGISDLSAKHFIIDQFNSLIAIKNQVHHE